MKTLKGLLILVALLIATTTFAKKIVCVNERMGTKFIIKKHSVALYEDITTSKNRREIASISNVRTKKRGRSITKTMKFEGNKLSLHIHNIDSPNSVDDYISMRSNEGHEIIYPLECTVK